MLPFSSTILANFDAKMRKKSYTASPRPVQLSAPIVDFFKYYFQFSLPSQVNYDPTMFLNLILFLDLSFEFKVRTSVKFLADLRLQFLLQRKVQKFLSLSLFSGYNTSTIVVGSA